VSNNLRHPGSAGGASGAPKMHQRAWLKRCVYPAIMDRRAARATKQWGRPRGPKILNAHPSTLGRQAPAAAAAAAAAAETHGRGSVSRCRVGRVRLGTCVRSWHLQQLLLLVRWRRCAYCRLSRFRPERQMITRRHQLLQLLQGVGPGCRRSALLAKFPCHWIK